MCIFLLSELEIVIGMAGGLIFFLSFQPSTNLFSHSQCYDPHKRCSLGGLHTQSLTDSIYICENILKAPKDGRAKREPEFPHLAAV